MTTGRRPSAWVLFASGDSGLQELGQVELKNSGYRVYCDEDGRTEQWTALESRAFAEPVAEGIFPLVRVRPEGVLRCQWSKKGYLCPEEETPICGASAKEEGCTKAEFELDAQGHVLVFQSRFGLGEVVRRWRLPAGGALRCRAQGHRSVARLARQRDGAQGGDL